MTRGFQVGARSRTRLTLASIRVKVALRGCDVVGDEVRLVGRPSVDNRGHMKIGRGTVVCSRPVAAQLATAEDGALFIGAGVLIGYGSSIFSEGLVSIGDRTRIGPLGMLCDAEADALSDWRGASRPIVVGCDVRIGSKVTVLPGTYIGDGAEIAAGSVVSGIVPPRAFMSGAPARTGGHRLATRGADVRARIAQVVAGVFSLTSPPALSLEPERLSGWNAGGALRLLLALEEEFDTHISDQEWLGVSSLEDLATILQRRTPAAPDRGSAADGPSLVH